MTDSIRLTAWLVLAGATGGILNALLSDNVFLLPHFVSIGKRRIVRPGLLVNVAVGGLAIFSAFRALEDVSCSPPIMSGGRLLAAVLGAVIMGALSARWVTDEADKRFLRAAVRVASTAPAAHPDTVRAMEVAPPYVVYVTALRLALPSRDSSFERRS